MPWPLAFVLTIFAPLAAINYYVGRRLLDAIVEVFRQPRQKVRWILTLTLVYLNLLPVVFLISYLLQGRTSAVAFSGEILLVDLLLTYPFWIALIITVQLFLLFALMEGFKLLLFPLYKSHKVRWLARERYILLVASGVVTLYSLITIFADTWLIRVTEHTVKLPAQYSALDGVKIAQISDVQGDARTTERKLNDFVEKVNALQPDLILFAGDVITSGTKYIEQTAGILQDLRAPYGVIAAVGDHDIFAGKSKVLQALHTSGIKVLEDTTIRLSLRNTDVNLSVVTYTYGRRPDRGDLEQLPIGPGESYRLMLAHQPAQRLVGFAAERGFHLFLAGHTHGGGIAFGIPGLFLVAPATFEGPYVSGSYRLENMIISVTNGLGFTLAPVRYHAPAEITLLTLRK